MQGHLNLCATRLFGEVLLQVHAEEYSLKAEFNKPLHSCQVLAQEIQDVI
jgi:hypothetical protein